MLNASSYAGSEWKNKPIDAQEVDAGLRRFLTDHVGMGTIVRQWRVLSTTSIAIDFLLTYQECL